MATINEAIEFLERFGFTKQSLDPGMIRYELNFWDKQWLHFCSEKGIDPRLKMESEE